MGIKVGILGTRGIPANYGGFETFAEELAVRLVRRGHQVTVYGRSHFVDSKLTTYRGVRIQVLPAIRQKYLETVSHTALSVLSACFRGYDVCLVCNAANAFLCWLPRLAGQRVALNVDGIERKRKKWNWAGRSFHRMGESLAVRFPDCFVTDARTTQKYYQRRFGRESPFHSLRGAGGASREPKCSAGIGPGGESISAVREPAGTGEQRPSGDPRPIGNRAWRSRWWWWATPPTTVHTSTICGDWGRGSTFCCREPSTGRVTGNCSPTAAATSMGGRSAGFTPACWRPWEPVVWSWSTTSRRIGKLWPTPVSFIPSTRRRNSPSS